MIRVKLIIKIIFQIKLNILLAFILLFTSTQAAFALCFDKQGVPLTTPVTDFEFSGDSSLVIHKKTGLMWRRCPIGMNYFGPNSGIGGVCETDSDRLFIWDKAMILSERISFEGYSGWRVPNVKELQSILEYSCIPRLNFEVFPDLIKNGETIPRKVWTSTPFGQTASNIESGAFLIDIGGGYIRGESSEKKYSVYLVRDTEADFENTIAPAFEHPRCLNCHAVEGTNFASGGVNGVGLPVGHPSVNSMTPNSTCEGCHTSALQPPGDIDPGWHAAPLSNDLRNLTLSEICEKAKEVPDSANSAHDHLTEDRLVLWAFDPKKPFGGEFEAAPPYNVEAWKDAIDVWRDEGLPCP